MSASSLWVTCGIITQLRARFGAEIRWIRERCDPLDLAELREVDRRPRRADRGPTQAARGAPQGAAGPDGRARRTDWTSSLMIRPLRPLPVTCVQVDAELAREPPHRRAGVDRTAAVRLRRGRGAGRVRGGAAARLAAGGSASAPPRSRPRRAPTTRWARRGRRPPRPAASSPRPASSRVGSSVSSSLPCETWSPTLTLHLADRPGERRRHVHRRLVGLEREQRVVDRHRVAGRDEDLDDRDVLEVADVRNFDRDGVGRGAHTVVGIGASASIS